jgi:ferritin
MITAKMVANLNEQMQHELYSSHLYLAMSAWSALKNLKGFAHWLRIQADEERGHAVKILDYLLELAAAAEVLAIDKPAADFKSAQQLIEEVLKHEQEVSGRIHKLYQQAVDEKDFRTQIFLQWFVTEQIEEEANVQEILQKLVAVGDRSTGIYWIDKELKKRQAG